MPSRRRRIHRSRKSRKPILIIGLLVAVAAITIAVYIVSTTGSSKNKVLLSTSMGDIVIQLRDDMPITTGNFKKIVQLGLYNDTVFHRVIADFMIQGGDITGTGLGTNAWPSISDEFTNNNHNYRGTIAMANAGPNTGSCQFFINVVNNTSLDTKHPVFGTVIQGMDIVDAISKVATDENDRPQQDIKLIKAELIE